MLIELEGSRSHAYQDVAGYWTIGVGHMLTRDELFSGKLEIEDKLVRWRDGLTEEQIGKLLAQDLRTYEDAVNLAVRPLLRQPQFDALVSLCFNIGRSAFMRSTLVRKINQGLFTEIPGEMRRWIYAAGKTWDGLVARREVEIECWMERAA